MSHDEPPRQFPKCMPQGWVPPVPAWSALVPHQGQLVVAYYGVQSAYGRDSAEVDGFRQWLHESFTAVGDNAHREYAEYTDAHGFYTWLCIGYWLDEASHQQWADSLVHQDYWLSDARLNARAGVFREVLSMPADRFEALQSQAHERAGAANACPVIHGPIREHNYWGATRDRLAASASDALTGISAALLSDSPMGDSFGRRVTVNVPHNLAVIRSGQAFGDLEGQEKQLYFAEIEPALRAGMDFLGSHAVQTGCFSCRFMTETDALGAALPRSFGLAHFASLHHLEDWARNHPTHLRIFNGFIAMATQLGGRLSLRLWHEVAVLPEQRQRFEYLNCHPATGLMAHANRGMFSRPQDPGVQA